MPILLGQLTSVGGPIFVALLLISVAALSVGIQKVVTLRRLGVGRHRPGRDAMGRWASGDATGAYQIAAADQAPLSRIVHAAIAGRWQWPAEKDRARDNAASVAVKLLAEMNKGVRLLDTAVQAAPMLGLLGTVLGMIVSFNEMATGSALDPAQLAGGIWIALSTTALGLAIAIPFYFLTSWIDGRIENERFAMDEAILAVVYGPGPEFAPRPGEAPPHRAAETIVPAAAPQPSW